MTAAALTEERLCRAAAESHTTHVLSASCGLRPWVAADERRDEGMEVFGVRKKGGSAGTLDKAGRGGRAREDESPLDLALIRVGADEAASLSPDGSRVHVFDSATGVTICEAGRA